MHWKDRTTADPAIVAGKPTIKGSRISVELILDRVSDGWTMEDILASYPHISREDVLAALSFAAYCGLRLIGPKNRRSGPRV